MCAKRRPSRKSPRPRSAQPRANAPEPSATQIRVRQVPGEDAWELVPPRCARDRREDLEEVQQMLEAGENEVARDECLWLLQGCSDCIEAHRILGEIALEANDLPLARGHFGYAFRIGSQARAKAGRPAPLPYRLAANQSFLESGKALAWCLQQLGKRAMAEEVVAELLDCDPSDPLGIAKLLDEAPRSQPGD